MSRAIIFDAQVLQTPAFNRGMGQYVLSLLNALSRDPDIVNDGDEIIVILSKNEGEESISRIKKLLKGMKVECLPLQTYYDTSHTLEALEHNKGVLDRWINKNELQNAFFIIGSLFQAEIYPIAPTGVQSAAIVYDMIPLQMFEQYSPLMRWEDYLNRYQVLGDMDTLFAISKTTSNDICVYANIDQDRVVNLNGGMASFKEAGRPDILPSKKFILMPTGNDIRKNNLNAIKAFELFRDRTGKDWQLI